MEGIQGKRVKREQIQSVETCQIAQSKIHLIEILQDQEIIQHSLTLVSKSQMQGSKTNQNTL